MNALKRRFPALSLLKWNTLNVEHIYDNTERRCLLSWCWREKNCREEHFYVSAVKRQIVHTVVFLNIGCKHSVAVTWAAIQLNIKSLIVTHCKARISDTAVWLLSCNGAVSKTDKDTTLWISLIPHPKNSLDCLTNWHTRKEIGTLCSISSGGPAPSLPFYYHRY